ncbi:FecR domain-containing protein [Pseudorhodoferax sp. Leaf274]|uniref:FecR domain-containing protein n=1 Tax=Pseudorhodoferax sp. Leaf274 TaxID=1736318 RepID=UPI000703AE56|nr:FecR domain-containing protein [Pseudorhodoferax sp. Leaf274]KQP37017.1 iron dicitrate transport regulator FecR [Pseudorhodoferax sp. Leaf274]
MSAAPLPAAVVDAAVEWLVHLWSGEATEASRAQWQRWRAADPLHEQAWHRVEATDTRWRAAAPGLAAALAARPAAAGRRRALGGIAALAVAGLALYTGREQMATRGWLAGVRTAKGEQRRLQLPDGTQLLLNTATALDIDFSPALRRLRLHQGELLIATAPDTEWTSRPFVVDTPAGRVQALGTRFTVRHDADGPAARATRVEVFEGAVELRGAASVLRVDAGQAARLPAGGGTAEALPPPAAPAWADGVLVASDMRLDAFVDELRRYRPGLLQLAPEVAGLRLSGVFPLGDTDRILQALVQVLPVQVHVPVRYWVRIGPA